MIDDRQTANCIVVQVMSSVLCHKNSQLLDTKKNKSTWKSIHNGKCTMLEISIQINDKPIMVKPRTTERERERKKRARM